MGNYSKCLDEKKFIKHFSTYLNMIRADCPGFSYTQVTKDAIIPTMNFLFPDLKAEAVYDEDYCDLQKAIGCVYFDFEDSRYCMKVNMIRGGLFPEVTIEIFETESLFSKNMREAVDVLKEITESKTQNIRIINKLIRGLSNGEFEPKDILACSEHGHVVLIAVNKSFYKAIEGHPYFLRFNIEEARDKNFKDVKVDHTDGMNVFKTEIVSMDPGDY